MRVHRHSWTPLNQPIVNRGRYPTTLMVYVTDISIRILSCLPQETHHQINPHEMSNEHVDKMHELSVATNCGSSHETFKLVLQTIQTLALVGLVVVLAIFVVKLGKLSSIEQILDSAIYNPDDRLGISVWVYPCPPVRATQCGWTRLRTHKARFSLVLICCH